MNQEIKPFKLTNNNKVLRVFQTNEKGYKKSIENNQIWVIDNNTKRLLPADFNGKILGFNEHASWYQAIVEENSQDDSLLKKENCSSSLETETGKIILELFNTIEQRKKDLPEGSYTSYLFNSGISKIKKKTGEEAVELILAESREEIIYEASDLIYHMLVLLSASGIKPEEIFSELKGRE